MGTKMFKIGSFEEDIVAEMHKTLISSQLENKFSLDKLTKAAEFINTAAELLDDTGFTVEADMLTTVLKRLANEPGADVYPNHAVHDTTEEALANTRYAGDAASPDQVIVEPLEQDIEVAPRVTASEPEWKQFQAMAAYVTAKAKKKV